MGLERRCITPEMPLTLEKELLVADETDRRVAVVDNVKKRAIMTVASYDEFKCRVACATLVPLARGDLTRRGAVNLNRVATSRVSGASFTSRGDENNLQLRAALSSNKFDKTSQPLQLTESNFYSAWRRTCGDDASRKL